MNIIKVTAIVATLLNLVSSNSISAAAVIEHDDQGDVHRDPPKGNNASLTTAHL